MLRQFSLILFAIVSLVSFARADDPLVGKRVVVINDKATLAVSGQPSGTASECSVFTVDKVQSEWLWIKSQQAFIKRSDVIPFEDAINYYTRKLEAAKTAQNYWYRAQIWRLKGELDIALGDMNDAIRLNPNESSWYLNRGIIWGSKKQYDQAIADYSEAIRLNPKSGMAYHNRGTSWSAKRDYDRAIADFTDALKYIDASEKTGIFRDTDMAGDDSSAVVNSGALAYTNRGSAWRRKGDFDKAIADFEQAIRLDPKYESPRSGRRSIWVKNGDWGKLSAEVKSTIDEGRPTAAACNYFAWICATCPDDKYRNSRTAIEYATKACELNNWKHANDYDTLGAAYAEAGEFGKAIETQQKAIEIASVADKIQYDDARINSYKLRLKLYQEKRPYRDEPEK